MQSASEQVIPAGMVAYGPEHPDYPRRPRDWDGLGRNMRRNGAEALGIGSTWKHAAAGSALAAHDIVAYTPKPLPSPAPMVEQAGEVIQADRNAAAVEAVTKAILFADSGSTEGWEDNVALGQAAINAMPQEDWAIAALRDVVDPLAKLQRDAEAQGRTLSGEAYRIANDPWFIRSIAKDALGSAPQGIASTPPADAGMLREALEPFAAMGRVIEARAAITFGKRPPDSEVMCISAGEVGTGAITMGHFRDAAALIPDAPGWGGVYRPPFDRAALKSQARQIREKSDVE